MPTSISIDNLPSSIDIKNIDEQPWMVKQDEAMRSVELYLGVGAVEAPNLKTG